MTHVTRAAQRVTDIMGDIPAASDQQTRGVEPITRRCPYFLAPVTTIPQHATARCMPIPVALRGVQAYNSRAASRKIS